MTCSIYDLIHPLVCHRCDEAGTEGGDQAGACGETATLLGAAGQEEWLQRRQRRTDHPTPVEAIGRLCDAISISYSS